MKIAFTGPECSGKSTVSKIIAAQLGLPWKREFAREYLESLGRKYLPKDIITIAEKQAELWNEKSFVADTEMLVCSIWYEEKTGTRSSEIEALLNQQDFDVYFLCKPDLPWEFDALRENPTDRERLFEIYQARLDQMNVPYIVIEGSMEQRVNKVKESI